MTQMQFLTDATAWLINITFWVTLAFPVVSRVFWDWTRHPWGRNIVAFDLAITFTFLGAVLYHDWRLSKHYLLLFLWIQTCSLASAPAIVLWRLVIIWRVQRYGPRGDDSAPGPAAPAADIDSAG